MNRSLVCPIVLQAFNLLIACTSSAGDYSTILVPRSYDPQLIVPVPARYGRVCGTDDSVPCRRGVAIMSPIESPDHCDYPVGGKTVYTAYYPDYCANRKRGPRLWIPQNGKGYLAARGYSDHMQPAEHDIENRPEVSADFGQYSGAAENEAALLRLGGFGDPQSSESTERTPDLIDMIHSGQ
jgi:hypothetical protein